MIVTYHYHLFMLKNNFHYKLLMLRSKNTGQPLLEDEIMTARTKKIHDLSGVLERQKLKVKELLTKQRERDQKTKKDEVQLYQPTQSHCQQQCTEVYQRICTEIIDIGNRVLPSVRRHNKVHEVYPAEVKPSQDQETKKEEDKEIDYLKSEEYRLYLQGITKDGGGAKNLIKKMKQARNHQTYLNQRKSPSSQASPSPSPRIFFRDTPISNISNVPQKSDHRRSEIYLDEIKNQTLLLDQKNIQNELQAMNKHFSPKKTLSYTPTMKDIHEGIITPQRKKQEPLKNIKLESKTIEYSCCPLQNVVKSNLQQKEKQKDKDNQNQNQQKRYFPSNKTKNWNLLLNSEQTQSKPYEKHKKKSALREKSKSPLKQTQVNCLKTGKYQYHSPFKHNKSPYNYKLYINEFEENEEELSSTFNINDHLKENGYQVQFKLEYPKSHKKQRVQNKQRYSVKKQRLNEHHIQSCWPSHKIIDSETMSTVTQSDRQPQTPSKFSKLTLVTPSRLKSKKQ